MSTYKKTIAAGETWLLPGGASFQILAATKNVDVEFILDGRQVNRAVNVPASFYYRPASENIRGDGIAFTQVWIKAAYGEVVIQVDISRAESGTNILSGQVTVNGVVRTDPIVVDENNYTSYAGVAAATGNYCFSYIKNPAGSGKTLYLKKVGLSTDLESIVRLMGPEVITVPGDAVLYGFNTVSKLLAAEESVAEINSYTGPTLPSSNNIITTRHMAAKSNAEWRPEAPLMIEQGKGVWFKNDIPATVEYPEFHWQER